MTPLQSELYETVRKAIAAGEYRKKSGILDLTAIRKFVRGEIAERLNLDDDIPEEKERIRALSRPIMLPFNFYVFTGVLDGYVFAK